MNIIWIFDKPLVPEAGGTERVTALIQDELRKYGYNCFGIIELNRENERCLYEGNIVDDLYSFLTQYGINIVINQKGSDLDFFNYFLKIGGNRWKKENNGRIISCLHFNPEPVNPLYDIQQLFRPSLRKFLLLIRGFLFKKRILEKTNRQISFRFQKIYDNSDAFVLLSESHRLYFERILNRLDLSKIYVIPNPLTFDDNINEEQLLLKKNVVLLVSRIDEYYKRISILLHVWRKMYQKGDTRGWTLKIVGTGPDLERYLSYKNRYALTNVIFEGRQQPERYYREAKIFAMTSISEGLPMTILEAFQMGVVPIVIDSCPIFKELIQNGSNGFLSPEGNLKEYERLLCSLMKDSVLCNQMANNALKSSLMFKKDNIIKLWLHLLGKL